MIHEIFPREFLKSDKTIFLKKKAIDRADHIICISENTKSDLINIYSINEQKISVVHNGFTHGDSIKKVNLNEFYFSKKPYFLYVGERNGYKNFNFLLEAFNKSEKLKKTMNLVCFGGAPFSQSEINQIYNLGFNKNQIMHFSGSDSLLKSFYHTSYASALIFPSLYEGFGIPPFEAMSNKCPVIANNTSCLPEVIGNAGEFFESHSHESLIYSMEEILFNDDKRNH